MKLLCSRCGKANENTASSVLCIMRHGRTDMNDKHLMVGSIDDPLNATGRSQAQEATTILQSVDRVISSPLARARETAEIIGSALKISALFDNRLRERCVGNYEGEPEFPGMLRVFLGEEIPAPGAEPLTSFKKRVAESLDDATATPSNILLVTHALPLLVMLGEIKLWGLEQLLKYEVPLNCVPVKFFLGEKCGCGNKFYEKGLG